MTAKGRRALADKRARLRVRLEKASFVMVATAQTVRQLARALPATEGAALLCALRDLETSVKCIAMRRESE